MENGDLHKTIQELTIEVAVLKTRVNGKEEALRIQAAEYERRLDDLNHAHALARQTLATYLPREIFDKIWSGWEDWRRAVDDDRSTQAGGRAMLMAIIAIVLSLATLAITLFLRWHT